MPGLHRVLNAMVSTYLYSRKRSKQAITINALRSLVINSLLKKQKKQQAQMRLLAGQDWTNPWNLAFTNGFGGNLSHFTMSKIFREIVRFMGLELERFRGVSIESGGIKTVQANRRDGTASFTLDIYGHVSQKMRRQSADRMEQFSQKISG